MTAIKLENEDVKKLTYAEFRAMEFDDNDPFQYELLNGILVKKSAPHFRHQLILSIMHHKMFGFIAERNLGKVMFAPVDVYLDEQNTPQPDLLFISKDRLKIMDASEGIVVGAPDLVVEIISPSMPFKSSY